jgi:hypothetical protein
MCLMASIHARNPTLLISEMCYPTTKDMGFEYERTAPVKGGDD